MRLPDKIVLATANRHKAEEINHILKTILGSAVKTQLLPRPDYLPEIPETGDTFLDNARIKASTIAKATGLPALADDSGISVDALGGQPGVRSSSYAGEHASDADNLQKLLVELGDNPNRGAKFVTVMVLHVDSETEFIAKGEIKGEIVKSPLGNNGFGYDPVFRPEGFQMTFAEMESFQKDEISHRKLALVSLFKQFL